MGDKSDSRLGKGIDAIIPESVPLEEKNEGGTITKEGETKTSLGEFVELRVGDDVIYVPKKSMNNAMDKAARAGQENPRIVAWCPKASIVLRVLQEAIPIFSMCNEAAKILEDGLKSRYPKLWKFAETVLSEQDIGKATREFLES